MLIQQQGVSGTPPFCKSLVFVIFDPMKLPRPKTLCHFRQSCREVPQPLTALKGRSCSHHQESGPRLPPAPALSPPPPLPLSPRSRVPTGCSWVSGHPHSVALGGREAEPAHVCGTASTTQAGAWKATQSCVGWSPVSSPACPSFCAVNGHYIYTEQKGGEHDLKYAQLTF